MLTNILTGTCYIIIDVISQYGADCYPCIFSYFLIAVFLEGCENVSGNGRRTSLARQMKKWP